MYIRNNYYFSIILLLLLIAGTLRKAPEPYQTIGALFILLQLLLGVIIVIGHISKRTSIPVITPPLLSLVVLLLVFYIFGLVNGGVTDRAIITVAQLFLIFAFLFSMSLMSWTKKDVLIMSYGFSAFIVFVFILWAAYGFKDWFSAYMMHKNSLGGFLSAIFFFVAAPFFCDNKYKYLFWVIIVFLFFALLYATNSRASWLAVIVMIMTYLMWGLIKKRKLYFVLFFTCLVTLIITITWIYPVITMYVDMDEINDLVQHYTGASFFSGRHELWPKIINIIVEKPFWGYGSGALTRDFLDVELSAHNLYLQITLQVGLVGVSIFLCILFCIWKIFWLGRNDPLVRLAASFLSGVMIHQVFDVSLTQNNFSLGILQWLVISIGISRSLAYQNASVDSLKNRADLQKAYI